MDHIGIGVFVDRDTCSSMGAEDQAISILDPLLGNTGLDLSGNGNKSLFRGRQFLCMQHGKIVSRYSKEVNAI